MAKYSTGGGGSGGSGDACELCGQEETNLQRANVAGAELLVCSNCAPHDDSSSDTTEGRDDDEGDREQQAVENTAQMYEAGRGDSTHWEEEGTDYESDQLPYLVDEYGDVLERGRQGAGLTVDELARQTGLEADDVLAVEQGRAARANVGGSVVRELEAFLEIDLTE